MPPGDHFLFITWDGGGNFPPELGLAQELGRRGHRITFLGHATQRQRCEQAGFQFDSFDRSPVWGRLGGSPRLRTDVTCAPAMVEDVRAELDRRAPDAIVVDCSLFAALAVAETSSLPAAVLVHTFYGVSSHMPEEALARIVGSLNELRTQLGLGTVSSTSAAWRRAGRVLVMSSPALDPGASDAPPDVRFIGPVFERATPLDVGQPALQQRSSAPLILVSLTTLRRPEKVGLLQRVLDGLADLPVDVVVTAEDVPTSELRLPANAQLLGFVPHSLLLPEAALVVTHGGHGTAMAALAHGVPLLVLPMFSDQPIIGESVEQARAGRRLAVDAEPSEIRAAAADLLATPGYRLAAGRLADAIRAQDGAIVGADELEGLLTR